MAEKIEQKDENSHPQDPVVIYEREITILNEHRVYMKMILMSGGSFLLWIGDVRQKSSSSGLGNLSLSLGSSSTSIMSSMTGDDLTGQNESISQSLGQKLSTGFNSKGPVYVSYNYPELKYSNSQLLLQLNQTIVHFVQASLENFSSGLKG